MDGNIASRGPECKHMRRREKGPLGESRPTISTHMQEKLNRWEKRKGHCRENCLRRIQETGEE